MPFPIPNTTTQDTYAPETTFAGNDVFRSGYIVVANNPVVIQLAHGKYGQASWGVEAYAPPATYQLQSVETDPIAGIRFRSHIPGKPAQVFGLLYYATDSTLTGGMPFTSSVLPSGETGQAVVIPVVSLSEWPPQNPVNGQTVWLEIPGSYNPLLSSRAVRWCCVYDAGSGFWNATGPPLIDEVINNENTTSRTWTDLATPGPSLTVPVRGFYDIAISAFIDAKAGTDPVYGMISYELTDTIYGPISASGVWGAQARGASSGSGANAYARRTHGEILSGSTINAKYIIGFGGTGFSVYFSNRRMEIHPRLLR